MSEKKILLTKSSSGGEFKTLDKWPISITNWEGIDTGIIADDLNYEFEMKVTAAPIQIWKKSCQK